MLQYSLRQCVEIVDRMTAYGFFIIATSVRLLYVPSSGHSGQKVPGQTCPQYAANLEEVPFEAIGARQAPNW